MVSFFDNRFIFKPDNSFLHSQIEVPFPNVKDARLATEIDISALRVWVLGPVLGVYFKKIHELLLVDYEDNLGIIQHLVFEGLEMHAVLSKLNFLRRSYIPKINNADGDPETKSEKEQVLINHYSQFSCVPEFLLKQKIENKIAQSKINISRIDAILQLLEEEHLS